MHILVAEDDRLTRELLQRYIASEPRFSLVMTKDGAEAWEELADTGNKFDCCVMDISMPGMGAFEVLTRMKETPRLSKVPVILYSVDNDASTVNRAIGFSVFGFLVKPCDKAKVLEKLHQLETALQAKGLLPPPAPVPVKAAAAPPPEPEPAAPAAPRPVMSLEARTDEFELRTGNSAAWPEDLRHQLERWTLLKAIEAAAASADAATCPPKVLGRLSACAAQLRSRFDPRTADVCAIIAEIEAQPGRTKLNERIAAPYTGTLNLACFRRLWAAGGAGVFAPRPAVPKDVASLEASVEVDLEERPDDGAQARLSARRKAIITLAAGCAASFLRFAALEIFPNGSWHPRPAAGAAGRLLLYGAIHGAVFALGALGVSWAERLFIHRFVEPLEKADIEAARKKAQSAFAEARLAALADHALKHEAWFRSCAEQRANVFSAYTQTFPGLASFVGEMRSAFQSGLDAVRALGSRLTAAAPIRPDLDSEDFGAVEKEICMRISLATRYFNPNADAVGLVGLSQAKSLPEPEAPPSDLPRLKVHVKRRSRTPASWMGIYAQAALGLVLAASAVPSLLRVREPQWLACLRLPEAVVETPADTAAIAEDPAAPADLNPAAENGDPPREPAVEALVQEMHRRGLQPSLYGDLRGSLFRTARTPFYAGVFREAMVRVGLLAPKAPAGSVSAAYAAAYAHYRTYITCWTLARFAQDCDFQERPDPASVEKALASTASTLAAAGLGTIALEGGRDPSAWVARTLALTGPAGGRVPGRPYLRALSGEPSGTAEEALGLMLVDQARHGSLPTFAARAFANDPASVTVLYDDDDVLRSPFYRK